MTVRGMSCDFATRYRMKAAGRRFYFRAFSSSARSRLTSRSNS